MTIRHKFYRMGEVLQPDKAETTFLSRLLAFNALIHFLNMQISRLLLLQWTYCVRQNTVLRVQASDKVLRRMEKTIRIMLDT